MNMNIREAHINDIDQLIILNKKLYENEFDLYDKTIDVSYAISEKEHDYFKNSIKNPDKFVFIAENENVAGFISGGIIPKDDFQKDIKIVLLESMFVLPDHRGKGIGKAMLLELEKWSKSKGANVIRTRVSAKNKRKIDFDEKEGFEKYEIILEKKL